MNDGQTIQGGEDVLNFLTTEFTHAPVVSIVLNLFMAAMVTSNISCLIKETDLVAESTAMLFSAERATLITWGLR